MSMPIINFKFTNTATDQNLQDLVTQKFQSLERFVGDETDVKCDVEFEKVTDQQSGNVFRMETNLWCHGTMYRAEATLGSFEQSVDEVRDQLDKELRRANDKNLSLLKKGGRKLKEMLRFGSKS